MRPVTLALVALLFVAGGAAAQDRSILSLLDTEGRSVTMASAARGALSGADVLSAGGRRVQAWVLRASPGDEIQVDLRSADFDAFLYVVGPGLGEGLRDDDGGQGLNSRLCMAVDQAGEYRVVASSLSGGTGDFELEVSERPGGSEGSCPAEAEGEVVTDLAELPTGSRTLDVGQELEGSLGPDDPTVFGAPAQAWAIQGRAGAPFSVDLVSDAFDAFLYLEGPGLDEWLEDDDGAGRCDARLTLTFPEDGIYRVVATSLGADIGSFRLIASAAPGPPHPDPCLGIAAQPASIVGVAVGGVLEPEVTYDGTMAGDEGSIDERFVQAWTVEGRAGERYAIDFASEDFDTYLYFGGPGFADLLTDDDGAGDLDSRLCVQLPADGAYTVYGGPYEGGQEGGRFTIRVSRTEAESLCTTFQMSAEQRAAALSELPVDGRSISVGEERAGFLDPSGPRHPDSDRTVQAWALDVPAGQEVVVDVVSDDFDPVLYIVGSASPEEIFADDAGDGCNTRLAVVSGGPGTVLLPGAFYSGASGSYRLRVTTDPPPLEAGGCVSLDTDTGGAATAEPGSLDHLSSGTDRRLAVGTEAEGFLGAGEESLLSGEPAQSWTVDVRAGDELVFELLSDDFDPVLYLDPGGTLGPLSDDDGAGNLNARIVYSSTLDATIRLVVTALGADGSGSFQLRAIRRTR